MSQSEPLSTREHYAAALRLLAVAEGSAEPPDARAVAAAAALAHATLAGLPRRARRKADDGDVMTPRQWLAEPDNGGQS
jgi:hypothetical protein